MGREIRRVPKDWKHPENQPLFDSSYRVALAEWREKKRIFDAIGPAVEIRHMPSSEPDPDKLVEFEGKTYLTFPENKDDTFEEWHGGPPAEEYYRPDWTDEERTHYQIYETVSEGSPISPVFATLKECENFLVEVGDHWGGKYTREQARAFCQRGWAPSMVSFRNEDGTVRVMTGIEAVADMEPKTEKKPRHIDLDLDQ
jgi:hypothetical protein